MSPGRVQLAASPIMKEENLLADSDKGSVAVEGLHLPSTAGKFLRIDTHGLPSVHVWFPTHAGVPTSCFVARFRVLPLWF